MLIRCTKSCAGRPPAYWETPRDSANNRVPGGCEIKPKSKCKQKLIWNVNKHQSTIHKPHLEGKETTKTPSPPITSLPNPLSLYPTGWHVCWAEERRRRASSTHPPPPFTIPPTRREGGRRRASSTHPSSQNRLRPLEPERSSYLCTKIKNFQKINEKSTRKDKKGN